MSDSIHRYVLDQLEAAKGDWPAVAKGSGVPIRTVEKIARRETPDPRVSNVEKLAAFFRNKYRRRSAA